MQLFDVGQQIPDFNDDDPLAEKREWHTWPSFMTDLGFHYQINSENFWIVGLSAYLPQTETYYGIGRILDYSELALWSETEMNYGICGWYYAYDRQTGTNAGFAPKLCEGGENLGTDPFDESGF